MLVAKIQVSSVIANVVYRKTIPSGVIGAQIEIVYAEDIWKGLRKTVVFRGAVTKDVITDDDVVTIPAEVASKPNVVLYVGVYGVDLGGKLAIPTLWANLGAILDATDPSGDTTTDPLLPVWAQLRAMIGDLDDLNTTAKENLVVAVNEAITMGGGEVDPAEIRRIVDEYLAANPPQVTETDPTVPAWAKQPQKPTYTAKDVHAMPDNTVIPVVDATLKNYGEAADAKATGSALSQLKNDLADKLDKPTTAPEVGKILKVTSVNDDGTFSCEWADESGGASTEYELVESVTLLEDSVFYRDKDTNGNKYNFNTLVALIKVPKLSSSPSNRRISFDNVGGFSVITPLGSASYETMYLFVADRNVARRICYCIKYEHGADANGGIVIGSRYGMENNEPIKAISLGNAVPAGTKISIWGISV